MAKKLGGRALAEANPELNLSLEICHSSDDKPRQAFPRQCIQINDPIWRAGHPDLTEEELDAYFAMVDAYEKRIAAGEIVNWETYETDNYGYPTYEIQNYGFNATIDFIKRSKAHIDQFR